MTRKYMCECEHECHTNHVCGETRAMSPNGNPGHDYGIEYFERFTQVVQTEFGTFRVCNDCAVDCILAAIHELS